MRLFIAFPLEQSVTSRLAEIVADFRKLGGPIKWVEPENMHLTVRFLGETTESKVEALKQIIDAAASHASTIKSVVTEIGGFPNLHRPRVIWTGLDSNASKLVPIAAEIEKAVQQIGFAPEIKPFKPHLTLGRVRDDARIGDSLEYLLHYKLAPIPVTFDTLALVRSTLTPRGPIYEHLHDARFSR